MRPTLAARLALSPAPRKRPRHRPDFDRLECRALPSTGVTVHPIPPTVTI